MKHNISITMDQQLFRQIENTRGREKRSTYIEHLIIEGLKNQQKQTPQPKTPKPTLSMFPPVNFSPIQARNEPE